MDIPKEIRCPKCHRLLPPLDVVRNTYVTTFLPQDDRALPPRPDVFLFVHEWRMEGTSPPWAPPVNTAVPYDYCAVPQVGLPLILAKLLGVDTMEHEYQKQGAELARGLIRAHEANAEASLAIARGHHAAAQATLQGHRESAAATRTLAHATTVLAAASDPSHELPYSRRGW